MSQMENDTIYFLILWLVAMFLTLATGILVIMYQVRCFPCQNNDVGTENEKDHKHDRHHTDFHHGHLDPKNMRTCMVCGEVMSTDEEVHAACHDVDVCVM